MTISEFNETKNATCTAYGGYPEPQISWTGLGKSNNTPVELQGTHTPPEQDPADKTYNVSSTVSVKNLQSVTCHVYNPRSNETITSTKQIPGTKTTPAQSPHECSR